MHWFALIIPILVAAVLFVWFKHKTTWWEAGLPMVVSILLIFGMKSCDEYVQTRDTEYWSGTVQSAEYFEDWNEEVPCRHPKYCTRTVTDSKGHTRTEEYQCGHQHMYDVDYHPEYWQKTDNNGITNSITRTEFAEYVKIFGNRSFIDLNRDYHSNDGDKYKSTWPGTDQTIDIMVTQHSYENRVQASHSVFNYEPVDTADVRRFKLFEYPSISNEHQDHILGLNDPKGERQMEILNAKLGKKKQVKAFILVYHDMTQTAAEYQERYWKGGNKNEFIVCVGVDKSKNIAWTHIISWTEDQALKIEVRNWVMNRRGKKLNTVQLSEFMHEKIEAGFKRKHFADFAYLEIDLTTGQLVWIFITVFIFSLGLGFMAVFNQFDAQHIPMPHWLENMGNKWRTFKGRFYNKNNRKRKWNK